MFAAFGSCPKDGHYGFATKPDGIAVWGPEVLVFIKDAVNGRRGRGEPALVRRSVIDGKTSQW